MTDLFPGNNQKKRILLIDGMYLIFSSFYAYGNMRASNGFPTGALYGFISRVDALLKELSPDVLIVALDSKGKTFRHDMYPGYKSKRKEPPDELLLQIPVIKEYLNLRKIDTVELLGYEGDDIIYFYQKKFSEENNEVIIFTADKDMFQLVDKNTSIFHPKLKKKLRRDDIKEYYGLYPEQIVDYLSLTGDASDNIPGAKGIGEKTAKKLIYEYGSLKSIFEKLEDIEPKYKKKLEASKADIELSKELIELNTEKPEEFDFNYSIYKNIVSNELALFYKRYSFRSLLNKIDSVLQTQGNKNIVKYNIVRSLEQIRNLKEEIEKKGYFAFDIETTGLAFYRSEIVGISISFEDSGYYIPFKYSKNENIDTSVNVQLIKDELIDIFQNPEIKKNGFNVKFDILFLKNLGIVAKGIVDDPMIASGLLFPNRRSHKLKELSFEYLNISQSTFDDIVGDGKEKSRIEDIPVDVVGKYCIDDSNTSLKLANYFKPLLEKNGINKLYSSIEIPLLSVLVDMEYYGIKVDTLNLKKYSEILEEKLKKVELLIIEQAGYEFNINSPKQLGELLFEKMKLPISKKTRKTKAYSTDIEVLTEFKEVPIVDNIIKYRGWKKLYSTYLIGIKERLDGTGKIHTSFNQSITATGRLSSSNPNLQNIPVFESDDINIRKLFVSDENKKLLAVDYSQIELRVLAHFSKDEGLIDAFNRGLDIHTQTANLVFGGNLFMDKKLKRKRAKIINFSIIYGSGPYSLSKELDVSFKEAKEFIDTYFDKYSGVREFIDETIAFAETNGFVKTMFGRYRELPELKSDTQNIRENGKRMAVNTIIQGTAAEIIKIAMINIYNKIKQTDNKMLLSVHDEIIFEYPLNEEKKIIKIVSNEMKNAVKLRVPLEVSVKTGKNWGEMVEIAE